MGKKLLYSKQFGFRKGHYKDHSIVQSLAQIYESFENNNCTLDVFVDRSSHPEVFLGKGVLKICSKYTGEQPCQSAISIKLLCNPCQSAILIKLFATLLKSHFGMGVLL